MDDDAVSYVFLAWIFSSNNGVGCRIHSLFKQHIKHQIDLPHYLLSCATSGDNIF